MPGVMSISHPELSFEDGYLTHPFSMTQLKARTTSSIGTLKKTIQ
jgi:hypothetical protein